MAKGKICRIESGQKVMARNLCEKHYQWAWKHKFIP